MITDIINISVNRKQMIKSQRRDCVFLEIKSLNKIYRNGEEDFYAVKNLDLELEKGELCIVLGESGSGKSTLMNMIGGLDSISSGSIKINGTDISKMNKRELTEYRRYYVGFVFQFYNLVSNLSLKDNIRVCSRLGENSLDIEDLMKTVGIHEHRNKYPNQVSGGQQQRVAIARAIVKNPKLLLCDEPTGALDSKTSKQVLKLFEDINRKYDTTIMMITHNPMIADIGDKVIRIRDGQIIEEYDNKKRKSIDEVYHDFK